MIYLNNKYLEKALFDAKLQIICVEKYLIAFYLFVYNVKKRCTIAIFKHSCGLNIQNCVIRNRKF